MKYELIKLIEMLQDEKFINKLYYLVKAAIEKKGSS